MQRRHFFKAGAALAVAAASPLLTRRADGAQRPQAPEDGGSLDRNWRQGAAPNQRLLLKGGTIVSLDPKVGDFVKGDVLIEGKKIVNVAAEIRAQAQIIDASNTIVIPGFVDAHRHSWEGQLRRIIPDGAIGAYMATTHQGFARYYRPNDIYVGNVITALGCIDAGITGLIDNSHTSRSAAHSDAAVQALIDAGIRGVHASGAPAAGEWDRQWPQDLERLQKRFFASADQLVTLRMFSGMNRQSWALARRLGIRITTESSAAGPDFDAFFTEKLIGPDNTFNHCQGWPDQIWQLAVRQGYWCDGERGCGVGCAVWARRGRLRLPAGARPRDAARRQRRQRSVVRHRHVHRDARGLQPAARDGHLSQRPWGRETVG